MNTKKELEEVKDAMSVKEASLKTYPMGKGEEDTIFIIDTETGGLNPTIHALLDLHLRSLQSDFKKTFRFPPTKSVSHDALCVNNLSWIDLLSRDAKDWKESIDELAEIMNRKVTFIGHNIDFDIGFIEKNLMNNFLCYTIDTKTLARRLWPGLTSYSLENLAKHKLKEYDKELAHSAEYDCYLTEKLLRKLLEEDKEDKLKLKWLAMELKNLN